MKHVLFMALGLVTLSSAAMADCAPYAYQTCQPSDNGEPGNCPMDPITTSIVPLNKCGDIYTYENQCDCGNTPPPAPTPQY